MNEDKIIQMLLQHGEDIQYLKENMASLSTKDDIRKMSTGVETLIGLAKKRDEEVTMITHGMRRHEDRLDRHEADIKHIKPLVGLA
ncbi:MAG: hypothetical protein AAB932_03890 [Patescibacteria group bacterium]